MDMKKIVQIVVEDGFIFVLLEDGTLWYRDNTGGVWRQIDGPLFT